MIVSDYYLFLRRGAGCIGLLIRTCWATMIKEKKNSLAPIDPTYCGTSYWTPSCAASFSSPDAYRRVSGLVRKSARRAPIFSPGQSHSDTRAHEPYKLGKIQDNCSPFPTWPWVTQGHGLDIMFCVSCHRGEKRHSLENQCLWQPSSYDMVDMLATNPNQQLHTLVPRIHSNWLSTPLYSDRLWGSHQIQFDASPGVKGPRFIMELQHHSPFYMLSWRGASGQKHFF